MLSLEVAPSGQSSRAPLLKYFSARRLQKDHAQAKNYVHLKITEEFNMQKKQSNSPYSALITI